VAAATGVALLASLLSVTAQATPNPAGATGWQQQLQHADYDSREALGSGGGLPAAFGRSANSGPPPVVVQKLRDRLGVQGIVDIDNATGTPRRVARTDGFLTAAGRQKPADIALGYVGAHTDVFGLDAKAVAGFTLRRDYVDIEGTHHLSFVQAVGGVPVFGNGLRAHVAKDGRLIQVDGAPVKHLPAAMGSAKLTATAARAIAVKDVGGTSARVTRAAFGPQKTTGFSDGGSVKQVWFQTADGPRLAWQTLLLDDGFVHVIDATSGRVLYRHNTVEADTGRAFANYPGAAVGGKQRRVDLSDWLPDGSPRLVGYNAHVYSDVNDNGIADPAEEVSPAAKGSFDYPFTDFSDTVGGTCSAALKCSWDPKTANSWRVNRAQDAVQMFNFLGTFHDHLLARPIGFTRTAGNFEAVDGDAVRGESDDGADRADGLPDDSHVNNANMSTPPDGTPPRMQMYLFKPSSVVPAANSGDESDVVYHEYTHGLSNRLVVDTSGVSTLDGAQAGAMGEGWSDWYAEDFLVNKGLEKDTAATGDVRVGKYVTSGGTIRTEPLDCTVGAPAEVCPGSPTVGSGGFTYGDYGRISGYPEPHDDGEIWAQTLWDLRKAVGSTQAESLITRAMELSPANPSFLDERNSILQADLVVDGGKLQRKIWRVFAHRGMGYFAAVTDGDDTEPVEDFSMPPAANTPRGTLTGTVTDRNTGAPAGGVTIAFGGHASGFAGGLVATTAANGTYTISGILPGTYAKVMARGGGYDPEQTTLSIPSHTLRQDWTVHRNWAAAAGGGSVVGFTGPDFSPRCGPSKLIDQSRDSGWLSMVAPEGRTVVLRLAAKVDIAQLVIDPTPSCFPIPSVGIGHYQVETSTDGTTWTTAATGAFPQGTTTPTQVVLAAGTGNGVGYIRYTMLTTQAQDAGPCPPGSMDLGCYLISSSELAVYGTRG
jgi:extracellular elastinolytic metalloproteinase